MYKNDLPQAVIMPETQPLRLNFSGRVILLQESHFELCISPREATYSAFIIVLILQSLSSQNKLVNGLSMTEQGTAGMRHEAGKF